MGKRSKGRDKPTKARKPEHWVALRDDGTWVHGGRGEPPPKQLTWFEVHRDRLVGALPSGVIRGEPTKQNLGMYDHPFYAYADRHFVCRTCGEADVFTAEAQRYWYEELAQYVWAGPSRCSSCRRVDRARRRARVQYAEAATAYGVEANPTTAIAFVRATVEAVDEVGPRARARAHGVARGLVKSGVAEAEAWARELA